MSEIPFRGGALCLCVPWDRTRVEFSGVHVRCSGRQFRGCADTVEEKYASFDDLELKRADMQLLADEENVVICTEPKPWCWLPAAKNPGRIKYRAPDEAKEQFWSASGNWTREDTVWDEKVADQCDWILNTEYWIKSVLKRIVVNQIRGLLRVLLTRCRFLLQSEITFHVSRWWALRAFASTSVRNMVPSI